MRVGKSQFSLEISSAEISPSVCTAKLRCFVFKEMDHCYVVCVVLRCKFSQLRLMLIKKSGKIAAFFS
jgi:hypothetical protein